MINMMKSRRGGSLGRGELPRPPFSAPDRRSEPAAATHEAAVGGIRAAERCWAPTATTEPAATPAAAEPAAEHVADDDAAQHGAGVVAGAVARGVGHLRGLNVRLGQRLGLRGQRRGVVGIPDRVVEVGRVLGGVDLARRLGQSGPRLGPDAAPPVVDVVGHGVHP